MMIDIFGECPPQRGFPKQNEFGEAFLLIRAHPADSEGWRSAFRTDVDHDSEVMAISVRTETDQFCGCSSER
jgi:hypothetical protein